LSAWLSRKSKFDTTSLALTRLGQPVAFHVEPDASVFERGSVLYFLSGGKKLNPSTQQNSTRPERCARL